MFGDKLGYVTRVKLANFKQDLISSVAEHKQELVSLAVTLGIGVASILLFYKGIFVLAVPFLAWAIARPLASEQKRFSNFVISERKSNVRLDFVVDVPEVLKHESIARLHAELTSKGIVDYPLTAWQDKLLQNYRTKYKSNDNSYEVSFNIKNGILWRNGTLDASDVICDEIVIPYDYDNGDSLEESSWPPEIERELSIRVLVINGFLRLQAGCFSKEYSPLIIEEGFHATYQTHVTLAIFPLLYFSGTDLPPNYLNCSHRATESYKEWLSSKDKRADAELMTKDWERLMEELKVIGTSTRRMTQRRRCGGARYSDRSLRKD